ncbi:MAG: hypothetical protein BGO70_06315 [Bacteroidetes bacterium 43-93]|nr:DoxX family protein [Bacteroidota bacterium]OJW97402.1 MAG: hypothetical protein BGO70_06315 [Bacteroidetes bacterium 43-93]
MKRDKILYWATTSLVSLGFLASGLMYLSQDPELIAKFKSIGYPVYFVMLLGFAKLVGSLILMNPWWPTLKEWAYAGFTFTLAGAIWTHISTHTPVTPPLLFLVVLALSYYFYKRTQAPALRPAMR